MKVFARSGFVVATLALAACGGGGGGSGGSSQPPANTPGFSVSPSSLTIEAASTTDTVLPRVITGTISGPAPSTLYLNVQVTGQAVADVGSIAITGPTTGSANVALVPPQTLGPGSFSSVITITACSTSVACTSGVIGQPQTINVTYNVAGVRSSSAVLAYSIPDAPAVADLTKTFSVTGYPAQAWTISSNASWLTLSPANGNAGSAATVTASVREADGNSFPSGTYTAIVTLTPTTGNPLQIPVTMNVSHARANFVAPYVDLANTQRPVIIRGENLTRSPIQDVHFGNHSATSFTVIDGTEILATHPALPAGTYPVSLISADNVPSRASLVLVDPITYASAGVAYPPAAGTISPICLVHDPERDALLVGLRYDDAGTISTRLSRYKRTPAWSVDADVAIANLGSCSLTTDGTRVLVTHFANGLGAQPLTVSELDPISLLTQAQTSDPEIKSQQAALVTANDGSTLLKAGPQTRVYSQLAKQISPMLVNMVGATAVSGDGSLLLVGSSQGSALRRYASSPPRLLDVPFQFATSEIALDRSGTRIAMKQGAGTVFLYTGNFGFLDMLPTTTRSFALAPSSNMVYTLDVNGPTISVRRFNATTGPITEVMPALALPSSLGNVGPTGTVSMKVAHDEGALFIAGSAGIAVVKLN